MPKWTFKDWIKSASLMGAITLPFPFSTAALAAGSLVDLIWPEKSTKEITKSPSYSWDFGENADAGTSPPMAIVYGKAKVKPVVKNRFITQEGAKDFLYLLYGLTGHQIDENTTFEGNAFTAWDATTTYSLNDYVSYMGCVFKAVKATVVGYPPTSPFKWNAKPWGWEYQGDTAKITDIKLNGNPLAHYQEIRTNLRPGLADQWYNPDFMTTFANDAQDITLTDDWQEVEVETTPVRDVQLDFQFPNGLGVYHASTGTVTLGRVFIAIQYRRDRGTSTDTGWQDIDYVQNWEGGFNSKDDNASVFGGTLYGIAENATLDPVVISIRISGIVSHSLNDRNYYPPGTYEVRFKQYLPEAFTCNLINVAGITTTNYSYPSEALLSVRAVATPQLNGKVETTCVVERSKVYVHNGTTWVLKDANNHAWAVYDLLANGHADHPMLNSSYSDADGSHYGAGINRTKIDYDSFNTWATNITALGFECNIVFDTFMNPWDAIMRLQEGGRGIVRVIGTKITAIAIKQETPTQLFCQGNMFFDTFKERWLNKEKRPNNIEVTYWDATRDYERTTLAVRSTSWDSDTNPDRTEAIYLYDCTDMDQALKTARFRLRYNELYDQMATFDVGVDTLNAKIGEVIKVQSDVSQWGTGGRIETVYDETWETWVQIDKQVTMEFGETYEIEMRHNADDTLELLTVLDTAYWIDNGAFTTDLTNWQTLFGAVLTREATYFNGGPAMKVTVVPGNVNLDGARNDTFMPTHGKTYTASAWVRASSVMTVRMALSQAGSGNDTIVIATDDWYLLSVTFVADTSVPAVEYLRMDIQESVDGAIDFYVGGVMVVEGSTPGNPASTDDVLADVTTDTIRTTTDWATTPEQYNIYAFTDEGMLYKEFRILDINRSGDLNRSLVAMEYSDALFDTLIIPDVTIDDREEFAGILKLLAKEIPSEREPLMSAVRLSWAITAGSRGTQWEVWIRDVTSKDQGQTGEYAGGTTYDTGDKVIHNGRLYVSVGDGNIGNEPFS